MSSSSARVREFRRRERDGKRQFRLTLDVAKVEALLVHEHLLDPMVEPDDAAVDHALEHFIEALCEIAGE